MPSCPVLLRGRGARPPAPRNSGRFGRALAIALAGFVALLLWDLAGWDLGRLSLTTATGFTGSFTLTFSQPVSSLTLSDFFVRYQSISGVPGISSASGSGTLTSSGGSTTTSGGSTSTGGTPVPEPGMLGLFGGSLAALAWFSRRRRPAKQVLRPAFA